MDEGDAIRRHKLFACQSSQFDQCFLGFIGAASDSGDELRARWAEGAGRSRAVVEAQLSHSEAKALGDAHPAWGGRGRVSLRWILTHMIEEYARHNGHADLIRESIDGETGE